LAWKDCLDSLKSKFSQQIYAENFEGLVLLENSAYRAVVEIPPGKDLHLFSKSFKGLIELAWYEVTGTNVEFEFRTADVSRLQSRQVPRFSHLPSVLLSDKFSFTSFVVGGKSQFAYSASFAVAQQPGNAKFNPLLIYGGSGLGKTHLIQAIGNYILENDSTKVVRYLTADDFTREYVDSIKNQRIEELSDYYRNEVDVLLMDDVQFLSGKVETQNEFFHIFNALHQRGKQVVLTSDNQPSDVKGLEDRLISRFQWGLCVDVQPPDVETREAILRKKAEELKLEIADDIISYIAASLDDNVRQLEGAIRKILLHASLNRSAVNLDLARTIIGSMTAKITRRVNVDNIVNEVADFYTIEVDRILEGGRGTKEVALARQVSMCLVKELTSLSLKSVGKRFGDRDHSTVVHAIKTVHKLLDEDPGFRQNYTHLKLKLQS
jgi:chromosomal replication initiator protein